MKAKVLTIAGLLLAGFSSYAQSLSGKEIFAGNCKACHSIGGGDIVGPDLAGVTDRRDTEWIRSFVANSQEMVTGGDKAAVEVFNRYNKIVMPSHNFSEEELTSLVNYMDEAGKEASPPKEEVQNTAPEKEEADVALANTNGTNFYLNLLLGALGVAAGLLTITAGYLYRLIKS